MSIAVVGLDIGGTKLAAAIVDRDGEVRSRLQVVSPAASGPEAVLASAGSLVSRLIETSDERPVALGVATAGVVDHRRGTIRSAVGTIAEWGGAPVRAALEQRTGLPTAVENDVNAIAIAEQRSGAARGARSVLVAAVGTGVGGAVVVDGRLWRGSTGSAGELGHIPVDVLGRSDWAARCSCGRAGHLEALTSGPAIARRYQLLVGSPRSVNLEDVARAARTGKLAALTVVSEAGTVLGRALGGLANVIDPEVVVLAGGVLGLGEDFIAAVTAALRAETLPGPSGVAVVQSAFGSDAGIVGAAMVAFDQLDDLAT